MKGRGTTSVFDRFLFKGKGSPAKSHHRVAETAGAGKRKRDDSLAASAATRRTTAAGCSTASGGSGGNTEEGGLLPKLGTKPLRLVLVGHNPSAHAWASGHYYSNPSNRMFPILRETGIAPSDVCAGPQDDGKLQEAAGVGFIDVGVGNPGTDSRKFSSEDLRRWSTTFYEHLKAHTAAASDSIGCTCGQCGAPRLFGFTGKRQYVELLNAGYRNKSLGMKKVTTVGLGPQQVRPMGWPFREDTAVWVLTSTSGASALTNAQRLAPYARLSEALADIPWPLTGHHLLKCRDPRQNTGRRVEQ